MPPRPTKNAPATAATANEGKATTYQEETMNNATPRPNGDATATANRPRVFHDITRYSTEYVETLCGRKIPRRRAVYNGEPDHLWCRRCLAMRELDAALDRAVSDESAAILDALEIADRKAARNER